MSAEPAAPSSPPLSAAPGLEKSAAPPKRSAVEEIKEQSRQLRGTIAEELRQDADHFSEANKQLIKFHGSYQQENRDARKGRKKEGTGKHYMFMVRCKIPGGRLTAAQYLAVDRLAGEYANGTLRFTTRQGIQLHGVLKSHLHDTIAGINECLLSTLGACGDVERNVMACPAPHADGVHALLQETAALLAAHLAPRTRGYHEIWVNGKPAGSGQWPVATVEEPLYGKTYLPRKFKTGLALPEDNCIDIHAQDLGLLAQVENGQVKGWNVLVGGGMGMTHGNASTFPHLARPICWIPASAVLTTAEAVIKLFRDHGNRADRKRARIKYLVHDWGVAKFREVLASYIGGVLHDPLPLEVRAFDPHLGWHPQGDGRWFYGLSIENGRVKDEGPLRLRSGLRTLVERLQPEIRLTPQQDILLCGLDGSACAEIERALGEFGISRPDDLSNVRKFSLACPAIPTCGLAISESERSLPGIIDQLEVELKRLGLAEEKFSVRMTGCPNGCARPYQSEIGLVGRSGDKYSIFVGGTLLGTRINFLLRDLVPLAEIVPTLVPLFENYRNQRRAGEGFGDWCHHLGEEKLQELLPGAAGKPPSKAPHGPAATDGDLHSPGLEEEARAIEKRTARATSSVDSPAKAVCGATTSEDATTNGDLHPAPARTPNGDAKAATPSRIPPPVTTLAAPDTRLIPLNLPAPSTLGTMSGVPAKRGETFLVGPAGEERADYQLRFNSDSSVRETAIFFYGEDRRAAGASPADPLRREAIYQGQVDPTRLHAARKLSDLFYVGLVNHEQRDHQIDYHPDGSVAQTTLFFYDGDARAALVPSGTPVRRQVSYFGSMKDEG